MASTNDRPQFRNDQETVSIESPPVKDRKRREVIKKLAVGTAAVTGCSLLPDKWTTPLVEFGALPAHATTSGLMEELIKAIEETEATQKQAATPEAQSVAQSTAESADEPAAEQATLEASTAQETKDSEWTMIQWGGDPNETSENRDRTWWTKIHGGSWPHWHRKFPLPGWVDDRSYRLEFVFSDGEIFTVYDSRKMAMNPNGPKYRPEEHDETDPRKQHPKIGAALGAKPTWVKFRKV
ncbi:MAG: hypothetical protein P8X86_16480 [Desulfofustis sp.]